jgi:sulfatase modifying factor 1
MTPRFRFALVAGVAALVSGGWFTVGCNAILGIDDHELAGDASDADDGGRHDSGTGDASTQGDDDDGATGDAGREAGALDGGACASPGLTRCSGASGVQICGADGTWGAALACATGSCAQGGCVGQTTSASSCDGGGYGIDTCGLGNEVSCCTSLEVPGGSYARTFDEGDTGDSGEPLLAADGGPTGLADPATVSGFRLDAFEVTAGRFRSFIAALTSGSVSLADGSGKHAHLNGGQGLGGGGSGGGFEPGWNAADFAQYLHTGPDAPALWSADLQCTDRPGATWTDAPGPSDALPVTCANWFQAYAFCIWDGGFLPSEAEWELAAAGGGQQRPYPWGASFDGTSDFAVIGCDYLGDAGHCSDPTGISAPGTIATKGAGPWGHLDMAGNTWEWTYDYPGDFPASCVNCANLSPGGTDAGLSRVDKGGGYDSPAAYARTTTRGLPTKEDAGIHNIGFRCARTP